MEGIGLLAWRGAIESDGDYCDEMAYGDRAGWSLGMRCAAVTLNSNAVGYAKQMLADNQYFNALTYASAHYSDRGALDAWQDYNTIKNVPDNGLRLPMTDGQPDFVWADEVSGIVAVKRGNERLWVAPYWQAKAGTGVNAVGRFDFSTTNYDHYGVLETAAQFDFSGSFYVRPNLMDKPENNHYVPPDNPVNAYAGERVPLASIPAGVLDDGPFRGKCNFYAFRYGNYLIGMNATGDPDFELKLPAGVGSATNVATGLVMSAPVMVAANSTVVLSRLRPIPVPLQVHRFRSMPLAKIPRRWRWIGMPRLERVAILLSAPQSRGGPVHRNCECCGDEFHRYRRDEGNGLLLRRR